jgi:hypothetical protein
MATKAVPPSPRWRNYPPKSGKLPFLTTWRVCGWRQVSTNGPRGVRKVSAKESHDQCCVGWENVISSNALQSMVISRNLFYKTGVQNPSFTLLQCQILPSTSLRAVRSEYSAYYIVVAFIYRRFLIRLRYILQATSLQRIVNTKNKEGNKSTRWTVSSLFFSRWKVLLHTVYIFNIFYVDWG